MLSQENKIGMDLIAENDHTVSSADLSKGSQFLPCPDSSHRIVRAAQQKQLHMFPQDGLFEIFKIDLISALSQHKIAAHHSSPIVPDHLRKGVVHRLLDQYCLSLSCECLHRHGNGKNYPGSAKHPLFLDLPLMASDKPSLQGAKIRLLSVAVSKDAVLCLSDQRLLHIGGCGKIHIRNPKGQNIFRSPSFHGEVIFQAFRSAAVYHPVKIQIFLSHATAPPYFPFKA